MHAVSLKAAPMYFSGCFCIKLSVPDPSIHVNQHNDARGTYGLTHNMAWWETRWSVLR